MFTQLTQRIGIPFLLLAAAGVYFAEVTKGKPQDSMLIRPVFYLMAVFFAINAASDLREILKNRNAGKEAAETGALRKILVFSGAAVALVALLPFAGFVISAALFLYATLRLFRVENRNILYLMPIGVAIALYLLFEQAFAVPLPKGFLGF